MTKVAKRNDAGKRAAIEAAAEQATRAVAEARGAGASERELRRLGLQADAAIGRLAALPLRGRPRREHSDTELVERAPSADHAPPDDSERAPSTTRSAYQAREVRAAIRALVGGCGAYVQLCMRLGEPDKAVAYLRQWFQYELPRLRLNEQWAAGARDWLATRWRYDAPAKTWREQGAAATRAALRLAGIDGAVLKAALCADRQASRRAPESLPPSVERRRIEREARRAFMAPLQRRRKRSR